MPTGPTQHPHLSFQVEGSVSEEIVAGSPVTIKCTANEGNPEPLLTLLKNGETLTSHTTGELTRTFIPEQEDNAAVFSCSAINAAMQDALSSELVLNVKCKSIALIYNKCITPLLSWTK